MPFEVPGSWEWTTLGHIGIWQSGGTPSRSNKSYYGGNIPWLKTGDLNDGLITYIPENITEEAVANSSAKLNPEGSVLIAMYGATIGKLGILTFPATTNQACCACVQYDAVIQDYLFYFLLSQRNEFIAKGGGGAQPNISKEIIVGTMVPIPPLAEQERIVYEIKRWFALIDQIEQGKVDLQATIKQAKSKILDLAIHGKLVPQDPTDEPASELLKRINPDAEITCDNGQYGKVPEGWCLCRLGDIGEIVTGNTPTKDIAEYYGGSIPFYKPTDLDKGKCVENASDNLSFLGFEQSRKIPANSILVTCIGATIGKTGLITVEGSCNQQINAIIPNDAAFAEFIYYTCISDYLQKEIKLNASATTLPILNKSNFAKLLCPLPPLAEQYRIAAKIEELFSSIDNIQKALEV